MNFFFLVCVGREEGTLDLSPDLYEHALKRIADLQKSAGGIMVQTRCAPHYKRILHEDDPASPYTRATGYDGGGCPAGTHYCRIDPQGLVTPCPYIESPAGSIRERSFWEIWTDAPLFRSFREPVLEGRCGACEYRRLCGGCRARSFSRDGNLFGEDPNCTYIPRGADVIAVSAVSSGGDSIVAWTKEAEERLQKVPVFLRSMIKRKLEQKASAEGVSVTAAFMERHRKERERETGIKFR